MSEKAGLRKLARECLRALTPAELAAKSARICEQILNLPQWPAARVVCLFAAQAHEPDLLSLWPFAGGKTMCYPRVNGVELDVIEVSDSATLETSRWQLREPIHDETRIIAPQRIDLIFVPGLAFARDGTRLGRGGGFYDRLLARPGLNAHKVGVCFVPQVFPELPREAHDCRVDAVITDAC